MGSYCAPLVADLFFSVMRETSCYLFQRITNLMLLLTSLIARRYVGPQTACRYHFKPNLRVTRSGLSWFNWWVSFAPEFQCCYFCEFSCLFYLILVLILISMFLR